MVSERKLEVSAGEMERDFETLRLPCGNCFAQIEQQKMNALLHIHAALEQANSNLEVVAHEANEYRKRMEAELEPLRRLKASVDIALNSGSGVYKP